MYSRFHQTHALCLNITATFVKFGFHFKKKKKCAARATFDVITVVMFYSNLIALKKTVSFHSISTD